MAFYDLAWESKPSLITWYPWETVPIFNLAIQLSFGQGPTLLWEMLRPTVIRCVKSGDETGLSKVYGVWRGVEGGRCRWHSSVTSLGKGGVLQYAWLHAVALTRQPQRQGSPELISAERLLTGCPYSVWLYLVENNACGPLLGPFPQEKLLEHKCETKSFRRHPDLNQSHVHETELPIENCNIAKCQGIYLSVPEILISF